MSRTILTAAVALSLLGGTSAMAQHQDHRGGAGGGAPHGGGGGGGAPHGGGGGGGGGGSAPHFNAGAIHAGGAPSAGAHFGPGAGAGSGAHTFSAGAQFHQSGASHNRYDAGRGSGGQAFGNSAHHVVRNGAIAGAAVGLAAGAALHGDHRHYSEGAFPHAIQPERQYHWRGDWSPPPGFYYRHWGYGERLPGGWFARRFWITDFWYYGLAPAPYGYAWVREGPDALLVNVYTGEVVEVEYGLFY
jgi:Ni/Co efflux regulator RcnB